MSSYGRGKRRYNSNGYNGSYRRGRGRYNNKNMNHNNSNANKPFRILQRKQQSPIQAPINTNANVISSPPRFSQSNSNSNSNSNNHNNPNNIAAVLSTMISDPPRSDNSNSHTQTQTQNSSLGHQLLGLQKRGGRLYHYKRKDGTGAVIPIPQHHKKNYNKSIGRGKKFDKEREAALQSLQALQKQKNNCKDESESLTAPIISEINQTLSAQTPNEDISHISPLIANEDKRQWRRGNDRGANFRHKPRVRGRGRRGGKNYNRYRGHRSNFSDKWSDEEDYNRDRGYGKNSRWDQRRNITAPRHRNQHNNSQSNNDWIEWDNGANNIVSDKLQSPNMGPRHRHFNKKSSKQHTNKLMNKAMPSTAMKWDGKSNPGEDESNLFTEESHTNVDLENDILSSYLSCYDNSIRERRSQSVPFLDVRMCPHVLNEIEEQLTEYSDFLVVGVIGQQSVGKSTILSYLASSDNSAMRNGYKPKSNVFLTSELNKLISSTHTTHGIQAYVGSDRVIYLDTQPILSASILFSLTNHRRRCMREKAHTHESTISPMETWDIEMAKHSLFLSCICHIILVVSDTIPDMQTHHFLKSIYSMRQSMKINPFLKHDSSLRKKLKDLQTRINEKYDVKYDKQKSTDMNLKLLNAPNTNNNNKNKKNSSSIRPYYNSRQWVKHSKTEIETKNNDSDSDSDSTAVNEHKAKLGEEEALFYGIESSVEEDYKLFKLLNAQQRYGFPDIVFVQNKVSTFEMTPNAFKLQRKLLHTVFKHEYFTKEGEIGNKALLGVMDSAYENVQNKVSLKIPKTAAKESDDSEISDGDDADGMEMDSKMNLFFLPRVQSNKAEFENGCMELRNQIMSMAKPQSHSYKQSERDWFGFAKKIWHFVNNSPTFIDYRGN